MKLFIYRSPMEIHSVPGAADRVGRLLQPRFRPALLVCARGPVRSSGLYERIRGSLRADGVCVIGMVDIDSNPRVGSARERIERCRSWLAMVGVPRRFGDSGSGAAFPDEALQEVALVALQKYGCLGGLRPMTSHDENVALLRKGRDGFA